MYMLLIHERELTLMFPALRTLEQAVRQSYNRIVDPFNPKVNK